MSKKCIPAAILCLMATYVCAQQPNDTLTTKADNQIQAGFCSGYSSSFQ